MHRILLGASCLALLVGCRTLPNHGARCELNRIEINKALARRWFDEVINRRNLDAIAETYAADYVHHGPGGVDMEGLDAARAVAASILAASSDRHAVVERQVAEGDWVVTQFTSSGRHTGVFRGIEPTGKILTAEGICISRIKGGKIAEDWEIVQVSGFQGQTDDTD